LIGAGGAEEGEMWKIFHRVKRTFERSLPVTGHVRLEVGADCGDVAVREGPDGVVRVRGRIWVSGPPGEVREVLAEIERQPPIEQIGATIRIGDLASRLEWDNCSVALDWWIETPADTEVRVKVDSGDVDLADLGPELELSVDSGDVSLASAVPEGARWRIQTDSGDVEVSLPRGSRCVIEAEARSGDLDCELPLEVETDDERASARGALGEGATARIEISTDCGDISLRWGR
jgi:hypothetical protein